MSTCRAASGWWGGTQHGKVRLHSILGGNNCEPRECTHVDAYTDCLADCGTWEPLPGNVEIHSGGNITIDGCTFQHLGATAVIADNSSQFVSVRNSVFTDISGGGVQVGQVLDHAETDPSRFVRYETVLERTQWV